MEMTAVAEGAVRIAVSPTSWQPRGELPVGEWAAYGRRLGIVGRGAGWWIGDWLRYGTERFGERYVRPSRITGYTPQTLMNMVYVASRFEPERRRAALSWSHHAEVASLPPAEQDRWLERAESAKLSVPCLREAIRGERRAQRAQVARARATRAGGAELVCPGCGSRLRRHSHGPLSVAGG
jgi:hypothetical protein